MQPVRCVQIRMDLSFDFMWLRLIEFTCISCSFVTYLFIIAAIVTAIWLSVSKSESIAAGLWSPTCLVRLVLKLGMRGVSPSFSFMTCRHRKVFLFCEYWQYVYSPLKCFIYIYIHTHTHTHTYVHIHIKVKFSLEQAMKAQRWSIL